MMQVDTPAARNTDPITSHLAADEHARSGDKYRQQEAVAAALRQHGQGGVTTYELAVASGLDRYMVGRRMREIQIAGHAVVNGEAVGDPEKRRCTVTGKTSLVWRPVPKQGRLL